METLRDRTPSLRHLLAALACACSLVLVACGGDGDDEGTDAAVEDVDEQVDGSTDGGGDDPAGSSDEGGGPDDASSDGISMGGSGTLVLDGQTVELDEVLCFLEPQEAAAGGGQILFVGQGTGVDAEGQDVLLDVSRYDEDSQFAGDAVSVEIGDYMAGESTSLESRTPAGTVEVDGSTMRAEVTLQDFTGGGDVAASFELNC